MRSLGVYAQATPTHETDELITQGAPLVKRIAYHLLGRLPDFIEADDLLQAGMVGLIEAARRYDPSHGVPFNAFAEQRIRGAMLDEVRKNDWIPRSVNRKAREISAAINAVEAATQKPAQDKEVAESLGWSLAQYHDALAQLQGQKLLSLDEPGGDDGENLMDRLVAADPEPGEVVQREHFAKYLSQCIERLPERERLLFSLYYDEELTIKEIGLVLGVSESRVSQLHSQALLRLRTWINN